MSDIKIYLAAPFFNDYELSCVMRAEEILFERGFEVFSPRLNEVRGDRGENPAEWSRSTFLNDRRFIDWADIIVMLYHGAYSDSGTAWEAGYACGKGKPVIAVHVARSGEAGSNLMIHESAQTNITLEELVGYDFEALPRKPYSGKMI